MFSNSKINKKRVDSKGFRNIYVCNGGVRTVYYNLSFWFYESSNKYRNLNQIKL